jgi:hypothetical protein
MSEDFFCKKEESVTFGWLEQGGGIRSGSGWVGVVPFDRSH